MVIKSYIVIQKYVVKRRYLAKEVKIVKEVIFCETVRLGRCFEPSFMKCEIKQPDVARRRAVLTLDNVVSPLPSSTSLKIFKQSFVRSAQWTDIGVWKSLE